MSSRCRTHERVGGTQIGSEGGIVSVLHREESGVGVGH